MTSEDLIYDAMIERARSRLTARRYLTSAATKENSIVLVTKGPARYTTKRIIEKKGGYLDRISNEEKEMNLAVAEETNLQKNSKDKHSQDD